MTMVCAVVPALRVRGNGQLLAQLLSNLLSNVVRYAAAGAVCDVRLDAFGGSVRLSVADRGPGIPLELREAALQRFSKLCDARSGDGAGLGLPLAAALSRLHDGRLHLEDARPGLRVVVTLPRVA